MKNKKFHTSSSNKVGAGDFYGGGIKQPVGKIRSLYNINVPNKLDTGKAPKSLA
jgi:hypothetical protein